MPFTPYHFGPNAFFAFFFRRWIDIPVFILANVIVDVEVLFATGWSPHRYWHWHSLLIGAVIGIIWGLAAYPLRNLFKKIMKLLRIPYETNMKKMVISGVLGLWTHVIFDSIYHYDVQPFWPYTKNPLWKLGKLNLTQDQTKMICTLFMVAAILIYVSILQTYAKKKKVQDARQAAENRTS
ncbi:MAG: DUF4184 family protein [Planctomycetes bacterium]|nr:DUF4184 family protein [Planctomycetota bacterium]